MKALYTKKGRGSTAVPFSRNRYGGHSTAVPLPRPALIFMALVILLFLVSCGPMPDTRAFLERDIHPPVFLGAGAPDESSFRLEFSEPATLPADELVLSPPVHVDEISWEGRTCSIILSESMEPGKEYALEGTVRDAEGNSLTFLTHIFGYNPRIPELMLNEITTQGSSSNPDKVEIKVLGEGNTAGVCLYEGVDTSWTYRKVFPAIEVSAGEYIVVHFKPEGVSEEVDETEDPYACTAEESVPGAWDLWVEGGGGISGNNGVIAVYRSNTGDPVDGFLYSNRTSSSDENYRGFGSTRALERADRLFEQGQWEAADRLVAPEDAVDPEDSTATRSMCRMPGGPDTDSAEDWHIVPTSGSTFGTENVTEVYVP